MIREIQNVFVKDFDRLTTEVGSCEEAELFRIADGITNSAGNLALHLLGNLNHFIGHIIGKSEYVRDREFEFEGKVSKEDLMRSLIETKITLNRVFDDMKESDLAKIYPIQVFGTEMTTGYFLIHLLGHLNYHLGQINYHRRLIKNI